MSLSDHNPFPFPKVTYLVFSNNNFPAFHHCLVPRYAPLDNRVLPFLESYIDIFKTCIFFCVLHFPLSILFMRFIHAVARRCNLFIFIAGTYFILQIYHNLSILLLADICILSSFNQLKTMLL